MASHKIDDFMNISIEKDFNITAINLATEEPL